MHRRLEGRQQEVGDTDPDELQGEFFEGVDKLK